MTTEMVGSSLTIWSCSKGVYAAPFKVKGQIPVEGINKIVPKSFTVNYKDFPLTKMV